jgi:hypothetical protein
MLNNDLYKNMTSEQLESELDMINRGIGCLQKRMGEVLKEKVDRHVKT